MHAALPAGEVQTILDNIGIATGGTNLAFSDNPTIGTADAELLMTLSPERSMATADVVAKLRRDLRQRVSADDVLLPERGHRRPDPEFRVAGADRHPGGGAEQGGELRGGSRDLVARDARARRGGRARAPGDERAGPALQRGSAARAVNGADAAGHRERSARERELERRREPELLDQSREWRELSAGGADAAGAALDDRRAAEHADLVRGGTGAAVQRRDDAATFANGGDQSLQRAAGVRHLRERAGARSRRRRARHRQESWRRQSRSW